MAFFIWDPMALARGGGTALPTCKPEKYKNNNIITLIFDKIIMIINFVKINIVEEIIMIMNIVQCISALCRVLKLEVV